MQRPSLIAVIIGLIPFLGMCFTVPWWDRVSPMIFGLPFNLFWLMLWIVLSSVCMALAHRVEQSRRKKGPTTP
ncbi:DUF3311 domain-containing protein [Edaphobacter sp. 12200R-103]|jgi:hypothetical protein|uniref:DUF3311 domain-containing protein n=1 Tax=Edaphobacter sp. 12200R-103 TaxID=2703788 RepID=UPI00138D2150|nr:DUF3311 domain-containing protein [Edaphobacter sp. 12200R-103]QHS52196.1 DUF3311 domain-containing protein [Edaphobacter sp. 12200R-103]